MTEGKGLDALLEKHHTFVSGTASRYGVSSSMLTQAIKNGRISREARGVYIEDGYTGMILRFFRNAIAGAFLRLKLRCICLG